MFESADLNGRACRIRRLAAMGASLLLHGVSLAIVVIVPMIFFRLLPEAELLTLLTGVPPPPAPPPAQAPVQVVQVMTPKMRGDILLVPPGIPDHIVLAPGDEPVLPDYAALQIPLPPGISAEPPGTGGIGGILEGIRALPASPPAPPPPPPRAAPVKMGGQLLASKVVRRIDPVYPALARQARISGEVILQVLIDEEGSVSDIKVLAGHPLLREAAARAVLQWRYSPTLLNGEPVPVAGTVTVVFRLK